MTNTSRTIIFFGTDEFSLTTLHDLIDAGYTIGAVVTKPDTRSGRGQKLSTPIVKKLALEHNISVWQPTKVSEINEDLKMMKDPVGVLVSYGKIIPQSTLDLFEPGIINVHPSLLPKYRGPSPIEEAIKNGDLESGVSIMRLTADMDAGAVYKQVLYPLYLSETGPELYNTLSALGASILIETLPSILDGTLEAVEQDEMKATYTHLLTKDQAWLKTSDMSANEAERTIRAYLGYPRTKMSVLGKDIIVTSAHVSEEAKTPLDFLCRDGAYLSVDELIAPSGKYMTAQSFLNGYAAD
jgi:methionyl-tRNA formyltransferase